MIGIYELRRLNPQAWTGLLVQDSSQAAVLVTAVEREQLKENGRGFRYILSLDGYHDPISLLARDTNVAEALFYGQLALELPEIAPYSWFSHIKGDVGWIVHEEVYQDFQPISWTAADVELIISRMVNLHGAYWNREEELNLIGFSPLLGQPNAEAYSGIGSGRTGKPFQDILQPVTSRQRIANWNRGDLKLPSEHALDRAGNLAPALITTAQALEELITRGGWPGIFRQNHQQLAAELLDDPLPLLFKLEQLPLTLIHGNPKPASWSLDFFGDCTLENWREVLIGPSIVDLATFIIRSGEVHNSLGEQPPWINWPIFEETILDSYILAMGRALGSKFYPALVRDAFPAALCLNILTIEIPRLNQWISNIAGDQARWTEILSKSDDQLFAEGLGEVVFQRLYWSRLFDRFISASRTL